MKIIVKLSIVSYFTCLSNFSHTFFNACSLSSLKSLSSNANAEEHAWLGQKHGLVSRPPDLPI